MGKNRYLPLNLSLFPSDELREAVGGQDPSAPAVDFIAYSCPQPNEIWSMESFFLALWAKDVRSVVVFSGGTLTPDRFQEWWPQKLQSTKVRSFVLKTDSAEYYQEDGLNHYRYELTLSLGSSEKKVCVYHWTNWEEGTAPAQDPFSRFHELFKKGHGEGAAMVHGSAGVGRTGTFIAADSITRYLPKPTSPAAAMAAMEGVVAYMRSKRSSMVQTRAQFDFIYEYCLSVLEALPGARPAPEKFSRLNAAAPEQIEPTHVLPGTIDRFNQVYSRPTIFSCKGVEAMAGSVCNPESSPVEIKHGDLLRYMVADRLNLPVFRQFISEYYRSIRSQLLQFNFGEYPEFGEALVTYLVQVRLTKKPPHPNTLQLFKQLLGELYSGAEAGPRFEQLLATRKSVDGGFHEKVRAVLQDTWGRTHPPVSSPGNKKGKWRFWRRMGSAQPTELGSSVPNLSDEKTIQEKYGIATTLVHHEPTENAFGGFNGE